MMGREGPRKQGQSTSHPAPTARSPPETRLIQVHLLHLCQRGGLEKDAWAGRRTADRQINAGSGFNIARTRLGQTGEGAKR